jgi:hypothetical protein
MKLGLMAFGMSLALGVGQAWAAPNDFLDRRWSPSNSACTTLQPTLGLPREAYAARDFLWANRAKAGAVCLGEAAALWAGDDHARALQLYFSAKLRFIYDKARCVDPAATGDYDVFYGGLWAGYTYVIQTQIPQSELEVSGAQYALALADPSAFSYDGDLETLCKAAGGVKPRAAWKAEADRIRRGATEAAKSSGG